MVIMVSFLFQATDQSTKICAAMKTAEFVDNVIQQLDVWHKLRSVRKGLHITVCCVVSYCK